MDKLCSGGSSAAREARELVVFPEQTLPGEKLQAGIEHTSRVCAGKYFPAARSLDMLLGKEEAIAGRPKGAPRRAACGARRRKQGWEDTGCPTRKHWSPLSGHSLSQPA